MNEQVQSGTNEAPAIPAAIASQTNGESSQELPDIGNLKREYFSPNKAEAASEAVAKAQVIANAHGLSVQANFDTSKPVPPGYGLAVVPVTQRRENEGIVPIGLYIAAIPSPALIAETDEGEKWCRDTLISALLNKFSNNVRPRDGQDGTAPFTIDDFITNQTRDQGLSFYRECQPRYVKALKKKGLRLMNGGLLKQCLASGSFARQQFPKIPQENWEWIIDRMLGEAKDNEVDSGIVAVWRKTRDETQLDMGTFDLDELDELI